MSRGTDGRPFIIPQRGSRKWTRSIHREWVINGNRYRSHLVSNPLQTHVWAERYYPAGRRFFNPIMGRDWVAGAFGDWVTVHDWWYQTPR